jgi:hypothetical protein
VAVIIAGNGPNAQFNAEKGSQPLTWTAIGTSLLALATTTASTQSPLNAGARLVTAEQIVAAAGGNAAARDLIQQALWLFLPPEAREDNGTVAVLASQLRPEWLPELPQVQWLRVSTADARAHYDECGRLLLIRSISRSAERRLTLSVSGGNRCEGSASDHRFVRRAGHWAFGGASPGALPDRMATCGCA